MPINFQTQSGVLHQNIGFASTRGTLVTATTANTKSGWVSIGTATLFSYEQIMVYILAGTGAAANHVVDIGLAPQGAATGVFVLAQDLRCEGTLVSKGQWNVYIPVHVPKDSNILARISSSVASGNAFVSLIGSSRGLRGMPGYSRCFAFGTATVSRGVTITGASLTLTESAYAVLTNNSARLADAIFGFIGTNADTAKAAAMGWAIDIAWGSSTAAVSNQLSNIVFHAESVADHPLDPWTGIFPAHIPAGSSVQARSLTTSTSTGDNSTDIMLYGLEP